MRLKPVILSCLGRDTLKSIIEHLALHDADRRSVEAMRKALSRARRATPEILLTYLQRGELQDICEAQGLPVSGRKQELIGRLLDNSHSSRKGEQLHDRLPDDNPETSAAMNDAAFKAHGTKLDAPALEKWLWNAACQIRGPLDAPKFKDYILPLVFLKRLSDVFDDEIKYLAHEFGDEKTAAKLVEQDHKLVRFYIPREAHWSKIATTTTGLGQFLTDAVRAVVRENPRLSGVIDVTDFNATAAGQRIVDDGRLSALVQVLNNPHYRLGLDDVEPDILGRAYEYLLRKFAESQGQSAGEFYTPREIALVMAQILDPQPGQAVYDPCCGSGGLLIKCHLRLLETKGVPANGRLRLPSTIEPLSLHGQEINSSTFAMARMNAFLHDMEADIQLGDTMRRPAFTSGEGRLRTFDLVTANPMWNQKFPASIYENDTYERFQRGIPPASNADWAWVQHMVSSLKHDGRMAVVLDTNAVSRGSGSKQINRERDIRQSFVEDGLIKAVILLPENLFYNTGAPGIILLLDKTRKPGDSVRLINASRLYKKGAPKNYLTNNHVSQIAQAVASDSDIEELCRVISIETLRDLDYDLSPARHVPIDPDVPNVSVATATDLLQARHDELQHHHSIAQRLLELFQPSNSTGSSGWMSLPLAECVADMISGDWGHEHPEEDGGFTRCAVIRGTDFPDLKKRKLAGVPYRFVRSHQFKTKRPREGDLLIEISGGGKYQNTGRAIYFDDYLVSEPEPPLMFTNFTKLLRIRRGTIEPKYFYYYWVLLYDLGRTARYEKQPTNIKNFKLNDFLRHETITFPESNEEQSTIVQTLDSIHDTIFVGETLTASLEALRHSAMKEILYGIRTL